MAQRHALLIGISTYGEGLTPVPSARRDVARLQDLLLDPELGAFQPEHLHVLRDPGTITLASAIESFFANKASDDLLLLYFSGHGFRDDNRQLLLSTAESRRVVREGRSTVQRATTLAARDLRDAMERSRSMRQVVILDCCYSGAFADGLMAKDAGVLEMGEMLGGKGRAVLTSSDAIETSRAPETEEGLSVYTRFLVEGIQTGAADRHQRGWLDAEDLHVYAASRVGELAPTMTPQFFPTRGGHRIRVCAVRRDPTVAYRQKVAELAEKRRGVISPAGLEILLNLRQELGLEPTLTKQIEADVLQPFRDYQIKLDRYRQILAATLESQGPMGRRLSDHDRAELRELDQRLKLRPEDVAAVHLEVEREGCEAPGEPPVATPQGPPLLPFPATRGWLVRQDSQWILKTERISLAGYREELVEGVAIAMLRIPAGDFWMGSAEGEPHRTAAEGPPHRVRLAPFFLSQTPITQAQWSEVALWPKVSLQLNPEPSRFHGPNKPVEGVSWEEAMEFCQRLAQHTQRAYSLPSEAQWEYACRAGSATPYAFGEVLTPAVANYDARDSDDAIPQGHSRQQTTDVSRFPANGMGLHDMHGNVREWCLDDWHDNYDGAPADGGAWTSLGSGQRKLLRGGSWIVPAGICRSAHRDWLHSGNRVVSVGFRICRLPHDGLHSP